jgi:hypothetical protein
MKIEIVLVPDSSYSLREVLEIYDDIKDKIIEQFEIKEAKLTLDKTVKEIDLSKY